MPESLRLFIGIDVGDAWTERLSATADGLRDSLSRTVRWVRPELYHVTVIFLGDQSPDDVDEFAAILERSAASIEPFELRLIDLGPMGRHEYGALVARVHDPSGGLQRFRVELDRGLRQLGVPFDSKRLVPHVTIGRPRGRSGPLQIRYVTLQDAAPLLVREVNLVKSDLLPTGPRYETIASARFGERHRNSEESP
jgi:RNA 2',3'-cyclic 3'-phosphodiesterase